MRRRLACCPGSAWLRGVCLTVALLGSLAARAGALEDMAALDAAYIPALGLTNQTEVGPARLALQRLDQAFQRFKQNLPAPFDKDKNFAGELVQVERHIAEAGKLMQRGESLAKVHDALEPIREILLVSRRRNGIDYFVDRLTEFHAAMEPIVLGAKGKAALSETDRARLADQWVQADVLWLKVESARFDPEVFGFDGERHERLKQSIALERTRLDELRRMLDAGDMQDWIAKAPELKSGFSRVFMLFGNFEGLRTKQ